MKNNSNFETFLFISPKRFIISVNEGLNDGIYKDELIFEKNVNSFIFDKLDFFLNKNIFSIESKFKKFVTKIHIILDSDKFFPVEISIKKNISERFINLKNLSHLLIEAKDSCKKTIHDNKVSHMIITNYQIDDQNYSFLPKNLNCSNLSIDVKFICISISLINNLEQILKKYQISLGQVVSAKYIKKFLKDEKKSIFTMAKELIDGHNANEVMLVDKTFKNRGFFEKFFNFFS